MGLAEKKVIKTIEDEQLPEFNEKFNALLGNNMETTVNFDSFQTIAQLQELYGQCFGRIYDGFVKIADDDLGKEALQESVKSLQIFNVTSDEEKKISLSDGTLTVKANWENYSGGIFTARDYQEEIEAQL